MTKFNFHVILHDFLVFKISRQFVNEMSKVSVYVCLYCSPMKVVRGKRLNCKIKEKEMNLRLNFIKKVFNRVENFKLFTRISEAAEFGLTQGGSFISKDVFFLFVRHFVLQFSFKISVSTTFLTLTWKNRTSKKNRTS